MSERNPYSPPEADISTQEAARASKPAALKRFGLATAWAMATFMAIVLIFGQRSDWLMGAMGSAMISLLCGVVAICIPVKRKLVFVGVSLTFGLVVAFYLGTKG